MARPTKLTDDIQNEIVTALEIGCTYKDAARYAGVAYETFRAWRKAGEDIAKALEAGSLKKTDLKAKDKAHLRLYEAIEQAEANCAVSMQSILYNAAQSQPHWAAWWLERRRAEDYGSKQKLDIQTSGQPIQISKIEVVAPLPDHGTG